MKARQPIKTTAKKISTVQKIIGKNPNKNVVDVRPYGGYTSLAHKTESGSHIEQNYSVNVENQMQLMKKISEVSTLNTTHMYMQLGQLEKDLKQWEGKVGKVIKKKDNPLNFFKIPSQNHKRVPLVHLQKLHENIVDNNLFLNRQDDLLSRSNLAISTNPVLKINASKSRFSKYGEKVIKNANFWVEGLLNPYKNNLVFNQQFIQDINNLEASMSQNLTEKWNEKTSYLVDTLVQHLNKVDKKVVTSKTYYKSLKKQDGLNQATLDQLRTYYKSREKNQSIQWASKDKTFVNQLNSVLKWILEEDKTQRIEKDYQHLMTKLNSDESATIQSELYKALEAYYKTFEQNKWIKTLIMAQSPLMDSDLYTGVSNLYQLINQQSPTTGQLNEKTTVKSLYESILGFKTESINNETTINNLNQILKEQTDLLNRSNKSAIVSSESLNQLLKYLFVSSKKENIKKENIKKDILNEGVLVKDVSEIISLLSDTKTVHTADESGINSLNLEVLKSEYNRYYKDNIQGIQKMLIWINQVLMIKDILVTETLTDLKNDVEKHIHDIESIELIQGQIQEHIQEYTQEHIQEHTQEHMQEHIQEYMQEHTQGYIQKNLQEETKVHTQAYALKSKVAFERHVSKINRWKQWFKEITHHYSQNGLGVFQVKQVARPAHLTYSNKILEDGYIIEGISKLSHYMEEVTKAFKHLSQTQALEKVYEDKRIQEILKTIRENIEALVTYEKEYMNYSLIDGEDRSERVIEKIGQRLLESIGTKRFIYKENLYEQMIFQRDELKTITHSLDKIQKITSKDKSDRFLKRVKTVQEKIGAKHLDFSSKLLINPEDMQVYYMTGGNTIRYAATALSYEDIMNQIETRAYSGFSQMHSEIQNYMNTQLASEGMKKEMTQSLHYTAKHIHNMIQKLSQQIQQMLGSQTSILNQRQLVTYSQLLFGENGVEAVTQKLVAFVERQYLKTMGLGNSSLTAYMNSSNEQIKQKLIRGSARHWTRNQFISPWILQVLQGLIQNKLGIPMIGGSHYNTSINRAYNRANTMTYSGLYPATFYPTTHYSEDSHGELHQMLPTYYKHSKWSEELRKGAKVFGEYAYERFDQLYAKLQNSETFLQTITADKGIDNIMNLLIEKKAPLIFQKEIQQEFKKESAYGTSPSYYENALFSQKHSMTNPLNIISDNNSYSQQFYKKNESLHFDEESTHHQLTSNVYNDTLIAYATELAESSTEDLSKELLSQKELIEVIQSELAVLKEEKQVKEINIDKLGETLLKELSHRIRKDRQRKGWI